MPLPLTGDRHVGRYLKDGRLFISFRCNSPLSERARRPFEGDWVAWVGTWEDLVNGREGQYFMRLKDNRKGYDTAYPGVEVLPDGTVVAVTYGHWIAGEQPFILCVRIEPQVLQGIAPPVGGAGSREQP